MTRIAAAVRGLAAAMLIALAAPATAQSDDAALGFALQRGQLLYGLDRAAWVATDDMAERVRDYRSNGMRGYVVERDGEGYAATFFGGPEEAPVAYYRGIVRNHQLRSREVFAADARPALTPVQRRLVAAREATARATRRRPCANQPFNTAVIPPAAADGPIDVYLLTPQTSAREYPLGGHFRYTVAADGTVGGERAFTNSCLPMPVPPAGRRGAPTPAGMFVTHLLDPTPTEIHVFTALAARLPVFVGIGKPQRVYQVTGERIGILER